MWSSLRTSGIGYSQLCQNLKNMKEYFLCHRFLPEFIHLYVLHSQPKDDRSLPLSQSFFHQYKISNQTRTSQSEQPSENEDAPKIPAFLYQRGNFTFVTKHGFPHHTVKKKHLKNLQILRLNATTGMFPEETSKFPPVVKPIHDLLVTARVLDFHECDIHWGAVVHVHQYKHSYYDVSLPRILDDLGNLTLLEQYQCSGLPV